MSEEQDERKWEEMSPDEQLAILNEYEEVIKLRSQFQAQLDNMSELLPLRLKRAQVLADKEVAAMQEELAKMKAKIQSIKTRIPF